MTDRTAKLAELKSQYRDQTAEVEHLRRKSGEGDAEITSLRRKLTDTNSAKTKAEEEARITRSDLSVAQTGRDEALDLQNQALEELAKAKADSSSSRNKINELEESIHNHNKEIQSLKEEVVLKTSLHDSSQAIMAGLREQTLELSTQAREANTRSDSLEEELIEAQRMLSERSRECETMRLLIANDEGRTASKLRDMKERMETAIEERDKVEDEASTSSRRMAREVENLRNKVREATTLLKDVEVEKEELERSQKELKRRTDEMTTSEERAQAETIEAQSALQQLREALSQREREVMELERHRADTKQTLEERQESLDRLQKEKKGLWDELKGFQQLLQLQQRGSGSVRLGTGPRPEGGTSSRSSLESSKGRNNNNIMIGSPVPNIRDKALDSRSSTPTGPTASTIDYVYLKNVLLQFLEQKDKNYQKQLIPVLGILLRFDQ